jgi:ketosteroid isomerase-like protein
MIDRESVESWIARYEEAWRTAGTDPLSTVFAEDATYRMAPFEEAVGGLSAIGKLWEREREGADEEFEMRHELLAVDGDTAVVRVEVDYRATGNSYRDLWVLRFDGEGRCREFEEWPFWPGQALRPPS